jgi:hypothetical protein
MTGIGVDSLYLEFSFGETGLLFLHSILKKREAPSIALDGRVKILALAGALFGPVILSYAPFDPVFRFLTWELPALLVVFG